MGGEPRSPEAGRVARRQLGAGLGARGCGRDSWGVGSPGALPTGTVTLMFSDIERSTALARFFGDGWPAVLGAYRALLRGAVEARGGIELGTEGDGVHAVFAQVREAVAAAADAQRALSDHRWPAGAAVLVRMGLHTGEPALTAEGYEGLDMHRCARVMAVGHGGQVLLTGAVRETIGERLPDDVALKDLGEHALRDFPGRERLFQLVIDGLPATFPPLRTAGGRERELAAPRAALDRDDETSMTVRATPRSDGFAATSILIPGVVGRERELADLAALVGEIPRGLCVALLEGEAGVGKTTLARAAEAIARDRDWDVLACAGSEFERELAYAALGDLLGPLIDDASRVLPAPQRNAIEVALALSKSGDQPLDQRGVAIGTLGLLLARSAQRPLLLTVDDVQWLDASSLRVLAFVARRFGNARVGLVITRRGAGATPLGLDRFVERARLRRIVVGPLAMEVIGRLIQLHLQTTVPRPRLAEIHRASGGNPFYALELARTLKDGPLPFDAPLTVPANLRAVVAERLSQAGHDARWALLLVACMARGDVGVLRQASASVEQGLAEAAAMELIVRDETAVRLAHPLLAFAVDEDATPDERRAAHRALADVTDGAERARHLALATLEPDEGVAEALERAAEEASARAALETAARFFSDAARLTPPTLDRVCLLRRLQAGRWHAAAGDLDRARRELDAVIGAAAPGALRARALHARAVAAYGAEDYLDLAQLLSRALVDCAGEPELEAVIRVDLATSLLQAGRLREAQDHARRALTVANQCQATAPRAAALPIAVMADFLLGEGVREDLLDRATALEGAEAATAVPPEFPRALLLKWTDRFAEAREELERQRRRAVAEHDDRQLGFIAFQLGELYCWLGDIEGARDCHRAARAVAVYGSQDETLAIFLEALIQTHGGEIEAARAAANDAARRAAATSNHRFEIRCLAVLGLAELSVGNARPAAAYLRRAEQLSCEAEYAEPGVLRFEHDAVEALVAIGDYDHAEAICRRLEASGRNERRPWAAAAAARSRALLLAAAAGDLEAAERALTMALDGFGQLGQPLEVARTQLHLGGVRRRRRQKRGAREALDAAAAAFAALQAPAWAQRAALEAARIGGRPPAPGALTETERRIAGLAARGETNREIASALFMSVKSVERHLSHAYGKLRISSRRELRSAIVDTDVAPTRGTTPDSRVCDPA
jgi:class 3 adenylate cyclase/DNA-binding CsgD family transcriptional regulator